jgi:hypothetical protein
MKAFSTSPPARAFLLAPQLRALVQTLQERRARTAADRELARRLHAVVEQGALAAHGLSFFVHDGGIAVYGTVRDEPSREAVLAVLAEQPGTRRIVDHLQLADS